MDTMWLIIFSPSTSYRVFDSIEEEIEMTIAQTTIEKKMVHLVKTLNNLLELEHQMKHKKKVIKGMLMHH
jgi:hypothetical protein